MTGGGPRCHAAGCQAPVLFELLTFDRRPFPTPLFGCEVAAKIHGLAHCRRLATSRPAPEFSLPGESAPRTLARPPRQRAQREAAAAISGGTGKGSRPAGTRP